MIDKFKLRSAGQSLMELVIGVSLITVVIGAIAVITTNSLRNSQFSKNQAQATKLSQEKMELVRTIKSSNYMVCESGKSPPTCLLWEDIWGKNFGAGEEYRINTSNCLISGVTRPCLLYKDPNIAWDLGNGFTGKVIINREAANQIKVTTRVEWTDTTGKHSSDLVTIFSKI